MTTGMGFKIKFFFDLIYKCLPFIIQCSASPLNPQYGTSGGGSLCLPGHWTSTPATFSKTLFAPKYEATGRIIPVSGSKSLSVKSASLSPFSLIAISPVSPTERSGKQNKFNRY